MRLEVLVDARAADGIRSDWDELARLLSRPYCRPAWMLSWWRNVAPPGSRLRIIAGFDAGDDRLCGVAPFFAQRNKVGLWSYRLLGGSTSQRTEPLARPGCEDDFLVQVVHKLAELSPAPASILFDGIPSGSPWPRAVTTNWPGGRPATSRRVQVVRAPNLTIAGTFDDWFEKHSSNFRQQMRRSQRQLEKDGGVIARARERDELHEAVRELRRLHDQRWDPRGGSGVMSAEVERMLLDVVDADDGREGLHIWVMRVGDRTISSQAFLRAGDETTYWLGGFDDDWARYRPSIMTILAVIEDAFSRGDRRVDLGGGSVPYKLRFADGEDLLHWWVIVTPGLTSVPVRALLTARRARRSVADRLPLDVKLKIKRILGR